MKLKFVLNSKHQWKLKMHHDRDWLELPSDVTANILYRIGVYDILENAQKVCTRWRKICKDPAMWRVINMNKMLLDDTVGRYDRSGRLRPSMREMCKHAVDRSQGQLVDITIVGFANEELLHYIAQRACRLRRLELAFCHRKFHNDWAECLEKFPLLEELSLYVTHISAKTIGTVGRCCPMLTTLKINYAVGGYNCNEIANAIGKNLPELKHLELIGHLMSNTGLQVILDGCRHLELLDLRHCHCINLDGEFGKKCSEKIKCLKLPCESLEGCPYIDDEEPIAGF